MDSQGPTTIHVKNISTQTSEDQVRDFFSFCGKISSISVTKDNEGTQSAAVTFEKVSPTPLTSLPTPTPFTCSCRKTYIGLTVTAYCSQNCHAAR